MTIARDASSPPAVQSSGATTTTAAFTPPSSSVIFAFCAADANNGSADETVSVSDSASGTWNQAVLSNANGGAVAAIFWRLCASSPGSITVSVTDNKGSVAKRLVTEVFTGTDQTNPVGATFSGTIATASYTSTRDNSWGWSCGLTANATLTAGGSGNTLVDTTGGFDSGDAVFTLQRTALTTPSGSSVALVISGTSTIGHHVAVEILPPGGTTFTKSLSGGLTPAGALAKLDSKAISGTLTGAGALAKQVAKHPAGGFTPAGALSTLRAVLRSFAGGFTPSGAVTRSTSKGLAGALSSSGTVAKTIGKGLAGALTLAGALRKLIGKALAGAAALAGALATLKSGSRTRAASTSSVTAAHSSTASVVAKATSTSEVDGD